MMLIARLILAVALTTFVVVSVASADGSMKMADETVAYDATVGDMTDCQLCDYKGAGANSASCTFVCSNLATFGPQAAEMDQARSMEFERPLDREFSGLPSTPAKQPPRTIT